MGLGRLVCACSTQSQFSGRGKNSWKFGGRLVGAKLWHQFGKCPNAERRRMAWRNTKRMGILASAFGHVTKVFSLSRRFRPTFGKRFGRTLYHALVKRQLRSCVCVGQLLTNRRSKKGLTKHRTETFHLKKNVKREHSCCAKLN